MCMESEMTEKTSAAHEEPERTHSSPDTSVSTVREIQLIRNTEITADS